MHVHDEEYLARTKRYMALMQRQEKTVFRLCYRHARFHRHRVLDLIQEVRERIWVALDTLRPGASVGEETEWVRLLTRSVLDHDRRRRRLPAEPLDDHLELPDTDSAAEARAILNELAAFLPADDQRLLQRYLHGYTNEEIAKEWQVSPHTVENRLSLIRNRLKEINERINKTHTP